MLIFDVFILRQPVHPKLYKDVPTTVIDFHVIFPYGYLYDELSFEKTRFSVSIERSVFG